MIRLTRRYLFSATHRLHSPALSEEVNREVFGKCNNPFGHGHDYVLEVSAEGPRDPQTGRIIDPGALDRLVAAHVLEPFAGRDLNRDVAEFASVVPSAENLAREITRRLRAHWPGYFSGPWPVLESVRLHETKRNVVEEPCGNWET